MLNDASLKGGISDWGFVFRQEALLSDLRKSAREAVIAEISNAISAIFGDPRNFILAKISRSTVLW